jgi:hypothetical protein
VGKKISLVVLAAVRTSGSHFSFFFCKLGPRRNNGKAATILKIWADDHLCTLSVHLIGAIF